MCAMFSVVGFIFSFCLATSTAAQAGAIAGLGTAFISKPLIYEVRLMLHLVPEIEMANEVCVCVCVLDVLQGLRGGLDQALVCKLWQ